MTDISDQQLDSNLRIFLTIKSYENWAEELLKLAAEKNAVEYLVQIRKGENDDGLLVKDIAKDPTIIQLLIDIQTKLEEKLKAGFSIMDHPQFIHSILFHVYKIIFSEGDRPDYRGKSLVSWRESNAPKNFSVEAGRQRARNAGEMIWDVDELETVILLIVDNGLVNGRILNTDALYEHYAGRTSYTSLESAIYKYWEYIKIGLEQFNINIAHRSGDAELWDDFAISELVEIIYKNLDKALNTKGKLNYKGIVELLNKYSKSKRTVSGLEHLFQRNWDKISLLLQAKGVKIKKSRNNFTEKEKQEIIKLAQSSQFKTSLGAVKWKELVRYLYPINERTENTIYLAYLRWTESSDKSEEG
jgi:hypothetical protein